MLTRILTITMLPLLILAWTLTPNGRSVAANIDVDDSVPKELRVRYVTLVDSDISLSSALTELAKQTGNTVQDLRGSRDDPRLRLDLKKATFWQALDAIAREADARVSLYERGGGVALREGPNQAMPISYDGLFRIAIRRLDLTRIIDPEAHFCTATLEIAWEPRFQPFFIQVDPDALEVKDDKGNPLTNLTDQQGAKGQSTVGRRNALELEVRVPAPKRTSSCFSSFKGAMSVIGPTKMLTFTFDKLGRIEKRPEARRQTIEGVTVSLTKLLIEEEAGESLWTTEIVLDYPPDGPKFESFQSWIVNNEIRLERRNGNKTDVFDEANGGYETDDITDNRARLTYRFTDDVERKLILGKPEQWRLIYKTPGQIVELPVKFEFKDVSLP